MKLTESTDEGERNRGFLRLFVSNYRGREGLGFWRFFMVLGSFSPLFGLMAVRGISTVPDMWLWVSCGVLMLVPLAFLSGRLFIVQRSESPRVLTVGQVEENQLHILTYLVATLLPFYRQDLGSMRDLAAILIVVAFIIFLFWHLNLHYVNVLLAVFGYRVYRIRLGDDNANPYASRIPVVLVTRQRFLATGERVRSYRLSDTLYWSLET